MELRNVVCPRGCGYNPRLVSTVAQFNLQKHMKHECPLRPETCICGEINARHCPEHQDINGLPILAESGETESVRTFETGATRDQDTDKYEYEGFLSPLVLQRFAAYMHEHRIQSDGSLRAPDNWQKGIPLDSYMSSKWRHFMDVWKLHRGYEAGTDLETALCAELFNTMGYLHELLRGTLEA